jgi:hypothetical protein
MASDTEKIIGAMETLSQRLGSIAQMSKTFDSFDTSNIINAVTENTNVQTITQQALLTLVEAETRRIEYDKSNQENKDKQESARQKSNDEFLQQSAKQMRLNREIEKRLGFVGKGLTGFGRGFNRFVTGIEKFDKLLRNFSLKNFGKNMFKQFTGFAGKGMLKLFGGKFGNIPMAGKGIMQGAMGGITRISGALKSLSANPYVLVLKKTIGFLAEKSFQVFKMGITYGTKFARVMVGLPLQIVGAAAKEFGHNFRRDVIVTIGTAVENVKDFMDVTSGMGAAIGSLTESETTSLDKFADIRGDFAKLYGQGAGGKAAFIAAVSQGIQDMGQLADVAGAAISKSADNANHFVKATRSTGMAAADIEYMTAEAIKNGESLFTTLDRVIVAADATSKQFGVDRKKLSKNFLDLRKDIVNFGHLSDKELMKTSARLTQMGLSMKEAAAVFSKMDTFESAAQSAAMLSQTFGMNLDALQLLKAEKPEDIIEQFRESMLATGRSFDELNRHEKSLMASHTGLSAEALKMTMNYRNLGMSFSDIQKKMKEEDPTQQQIKNLKLMSGSLKEIKATLQGENMFTNFTDGVLEVIKTSSDLSPVLLRVSERFEDFYLEGLKVSPESKKAIVNAFSPIRDVLEKMVGDGTEGNKGLLDPQRFKSTFEKFTTKFGGFLSQAFDKNTNLKDLQGIIRNELKSTFDLKNLDQGNTIVGQLFKTSGELIGQALKGFAAFGPGLIDTVMDAFDGLVDFLWNYKSMSKDDNSIYGMLRDLFQLDDSDANAIMETFTHLIDRVLDSKGPFMKLYFWLNSKFLGLMHDTFATVSEVVADAMFGYNSPWYQGYKYTIGAALDLVGLGTSSNDSIMEAGKEKFKGTSIRSLNLNKIAGDNVDEQQAQDLGQIAATLEAEIRNQKFDVAKTAELNKILAKINNAKGMVWDDLDNDDFVKGIAREVADYRGITLDIDKANGIVQNAQGKLLGPGKMATLTSTPDGLSVTQYAPGDNLVAAKSGEISYAGNAASSLIKGMKYMMSPSNLFAGQENSNTGPTEIKIYMQVDGNNIAEAALDSGLLFKATQQKNGRYTLPGNVVVDASGNSVERTGQ